MRPIDYERARMARPAEPAAPDMAPLYAALAAAQGEFPPIPKNRLAEVKMKSGGSYSYRYADLADVLRTVLPVLAKHGLMVSQRVDRKAGVVWTRLAHSSGAELLEDYPLIGDNGERMSGPQAMGTASTYARRYGLCAMVGVQADDDLDGNKNAQTTHRKTPREDFSDPENPDLSVSAKGARISKDMTPRQKAEEAARAIMAEYQTVKTEKGLDGVDRRSERIMERLALSYSDLFDNIADARRARLDAINEDRSGLPSADDVQHREPA